MKKSIKVLSYIAMMSSLVSCSGKINSSNNQSTNLDNIVAPQLSFEEEYISKGFSYAEGGKFAMSMIANIGTIAAGVAFDSPTTVVSGIFSILTSISDNFIGSKSPSIADVLSKLAEMDAKLDNINDKLDKNYSQLADEEIRTQAKVDQVLLEEQEQAISAFNTDYVEKVDDYQRDFGDYVEQSYKSFVQASQNIDIYVKEVEGGWTLIPISEQDASAQELNIVLSDFSQSLAFLDKHYNVVETGFMDKFSGDIEENIKDLSLPIGLSQETLRDFVNANIMENFTKQYYENNHDKALKLRNLVINYSKQISGKGIKSIADRYVSRMKYMYNFASEMKTPAIGALANLTHSLDVNVALAAQACLYAGTNQDEIRAEYIPAREALKDYYNYVKSMPDGYCFLTNTTVSGGFYRARYQAEYTKKGNEPKFKADFTFEKINYQAAVKDDITSHNILSDLDHTRIAKRLELMQLNGIAKPTSYIEYLVDSKVLPDSAYAAYKHHYEEGWFSADALRFLTNLTTRELSSSDKITMTCVDVGNPGGDFFNVGWTGQYKSKHGADNWKGTMAETTYIDAMSGKVTEDKKVCAYATYSESHWYWSDDEYWAFVDNPYGNFFFILENVA